MNICSICGNDMRVYGCGTACLKPFVILPSVTQTFSSPIDLNKEITALREENEKLKKDVQRWSDISMEWVYANAEAERKLAELREENKTLNEWNECLRGENSKCCDENEKLHEMCNEQTEHQVVMLKREALLRAVAEAAQDRFAVWTRETYIKLDEALKVAREGGAFE